MYVPGNPGNSAAQPRRETCLAQTRDLICLTLPCDPGAPKFARDALRGLPEVAQILDDALVVVSELVTNAVIHSGCVPHETITLHATITGSRIRISVLDPGHTAQPPKPSEQPPVSGGGLGLRIVGALADHWGAEKTDRRRVWAELTIAR